MVHVSAVDELRARVNAAALNKGKPKRSAKKEWRAPTWEDFANGLVCSFDQTFTNTGWVIFRKRDSEVEVIDRGTLREPPVPGLKGFEDTLQRAEWMCERIATIPPKAVACEDVLTGEECVFVHEIPAVQGMRIESSLLGALGVRQAVTALPEPRKRIAVGNQHMKVVMLPMEMRHEKRFITTAVNRYTDTRGWNEHTRDALALGLTYLYDAKRAS